MYIQDDMFRPTAEWPLRIQIQGDETTDERSVFEYIRTAYGSRIDAGLQGARIRRSGAHENHRWVFECRQKLALR